MNPAGGENPSTQSGHSDMKPATEIKLLSEFLKICDDPEHYEKKYRRNAGVALTIAILLVFYCLSDNVLGVDNVHYVAGASFLSGTAFGLGIWFSQAGAHTSILISHVSGDSVKSRMQQLKDKADAT